MCLIPLFKGVQQILPWPETRLIYLRAVYSPGYATLNWRSCQGRGEGPGNGASCKWWSPDDRGPAERKWTCLSPRRQHLVRPYTCSSIGGWWDDTDVTQASSVHLTSDSSAPGSVYQDRVHLLLVAPFWPVRVWFPDLVSLLANTFLESFPFRDNFSFKCRGRFFFTPGQKFGNFEFGFWDVPTNRF